MEGGWLAGLEAGKGCSPLGQKLWCRGAEVAVQSLAPKGAFVRKQRVCARTAPRATVTALGLLWFPLIIFLERV